MFKKIINFFILSISTLAYSHKTCNILSFSGGGIYGAFEAGVLSNLINKNNYTWDIITGVSAGSMNAGYLSTLSVEEINKNKTYHIEGFKKLWTGMTNKDIYSYNFFINGLSLYNTKPFEKTLGKIFKDKQVQQDIIISATSLKEGTSHLFNSQNIAELGYIDILMSSTAIPLLFPPHSFNNDTYVDGGISSNILVNEAINYCLKNHPEKKIKIEAIITSKLSIYKDLKKLNIINFTERLLEIITLQLDNEEFLHKIDDENISITIYEQKVISDYSILDFKYTEELWNQGYSFENVISYKI
jgi:predicted acylesterase/phospholipase RssA